VKPPEAQSIHTGHGLPDWPRLKRIQEWLKANGIDPRLVAVHRPVYVLPVPNGTIQGGVPWLIDVIIFHEYYENSDGHRERNFITNEAVMFQRTVPLQVPFPADPTTADEGTGHGQEPQVEAVGEDQRTPQHQDRPQEDEQQAVRPAEAEEVQDRRSSSRSERPGEGVGSRIAVAEEGCATGGDGQVPEPEEVGRQEEVGGA
jgi:hypothetical protein